MTLINFSNNPTITEIHNYYRSHFKQDQNSLVQELNNVSQFFLNRINTLDPEISAIVRLTKETLEKEIQELTQFLNTYNIENFDKLLEYKPLFGVPYLIKDLILVKGEQITAQSKILQNYIAPYNSQVYQNLYNSGALLIGITNMDEFAFGSSTEQSGFGQITKNPLDTTKVSGGTSGGSAASIIAGYVPFSLGSDTGGSIRQPSSFCGIYGLRPTYGAVSRYGIIPSTSSFDQIGPMANNPADCQLVFKILIKDLKNTINPKDQNNRFDTNKKDQTNITAFTDLNKQSLSEIKPNLFQASRPEYRLYQNNNKKILGIPKKHLSKGLSTEASSAFNKVIEKLEKIYEIKEIDIDYLKYSLSIYYLILFVESASNLERFDGIRYSNSQNYPDAYFDTRNKNLGKEVKRRIMLGTYTSSSGYYDAFYNQACKCRELLKQEFAKAFEQVDLIITPTAPTGAFNIGTKTSDPIEMYLGDILTVPQPVCSLPAINIPIFYNELPFGLQVTGPEFSDMHLLEFASENQFLF